MPSFFRMYVERREIRVQFLKEEKQKIDENFGLGRKTMVQKSLPRCINMRQHKNHVRGKTLLKWQR